MCGIVGFTGKVRKGQWRQTHDLLRALLVASEHRGHDATGFVAQTDPRAHRLRSWVVAAKEPMPAGTFVRSNATFLRLRQRRCSAFIGHVRAATHGQPEDNRNNHPFTGKSVSLVHNGIIANHLDMADKFTLKLRTDCDSEVLLRLVEAAGHPAVGLSACLREVRGSMAVALYDRRDQAVWLARNDGRPLWLARFRDDRRWFFASTDSILLWAFRSIIGRRVTMRIDYLAPIPSGTALMLSVDGSLLAAGDVRGRDVSDSSSQFRA